MLLRLHAAYLITLAAANRLSVVLAQDTFKRYGALPVYLLTSFLACSPPPQFGRLQLTVIDLTHSHALAFLRRI
jgi:hypothetical protein